LGKKDPAQLIIDPMGARCSLSPHSSDSASIALLICEFLLFVLKWKKPGSKARLFAVETFRCYTPNGPFLGGVGYTISQEDGTRVWDSVVQIHSERHATF
jgi:hypothetical protein